MILCFDLAIDRPKGRFSCMKVIAILDRGCVDDKERDNDDGGATIIEAGEGMGGEINSKVWIDN